MMVEELDTLRKMRDRPGTCSECNSERSKKSEAGDPLFADDRDAEAAPENGTRILKDDTVNKRRLQPEMELFFHRIFFFFNNYSRRFPRTRGALRADQRRMSEEGRTDGRMDGRRLGASR